MKNRILALMLIVVSACGAATAQGPGGPSIRWSIDKVKETMEVGSSKSITVKVQSRVDLANVSIWLSPSVSSLMTAKPASLEMLPANQEQEITLTIRIPANARIGEEGGTVHVKRGEVTVAAPLGINIFVKAKGN